MQGHNLAPARLDRDTFVGDLISVLVQSDKISRAEILPHQKDPGRIDNCDIGDHRVTDENRFHGRPERDHPNLIHRNGKVRRRGGERYR